MKVIVIAGPTASGKTFLGVELAKRLNGEIISCDSMQIYKDIPICSAQPTEAEKENIPHHLMGFLDFSSRFTALDYREMALNKIRDIISRNKQPIIVGGTGMYFHWLIYKPDFMPEDNLSLRKELEEKATEALFSELLSINPETNIKANDRKRIIRALEVFSLTGQLPKDTQKDREKDTEFDFKLFCISPEREILYEKINKRVDIMMENGMLEEVRAIYEKGINDEHQAYKAIGCRQLIDYFNGLYTLDEAIEKIKQESRRYAKRQLTWMRSEEAVWLSGTLNENINTILKELEK